MKNSLKSSNQLIGSDSQEIPYWKRRPSEIRGYQRALYYNMPDGSYLRVDYHIKDRKVRIYLEDAGDGGVQYYSVINDGKITAERNVTNGRSISLQSKFSPLADVLASIPNREIIKIIGKNYGVGDAIDQMRESRRKKKIESTRKRYFQNQDDNASNVLGEFHSSKRIRIWDLVDIAVIAAVSYLIYWNFLNIYLVGVIVAVFAVIIGAVDMFIRKREPIFMKIIVILASGIVLYIYGYYYY